ncbi:ATP-binding protein [Streptomyces canus]|uniref:AAA family ATPase n=1 Tax=Streptomyces canus TaxID=58343 RepID=UPI00324CDD3C
MNTIDTTRPAIDHYLDLRGAHLVPTTASRLTQRHLAVALEEKAMFCMHGDVGLGKTLAVNTSLRDLAPTTTLWLECRKGAPLTTLCSTLYRVLGLPGEPPAKVDDCTPLLEQAFADRHRVLVCDEAQGLSKQSLDYLRTLWDKKHARPTIIFVGGENCLQRIRSRPALFSRILQFQQYQPLTPDEVLTTLPKYHALWENVPEPDLLWVNDVVCHGNFRNWAKITFHVQHALKHDEPAPPWFNRDTVRMVLSYLDTTVRSQPGTSQGYL